MKFLIEVTNNNFFYKDLPLSNIIEHIQFNKINFQVSYSYQNTLWIFYTKSLQKINFSIPLRINRKWDNSSYNNVFLGIKKQKNISKWDTECRPSHLCCLAQVQVLNSTSYLQPFKFWYNFMKIFLGVLNDSQRIRIKNV